MNVYSKKIITVLLCLTLTLALPFCLKAEKQSADEEAGLPTISGVSQKLVVREYNSKVNVRSDVTAVSAEGQSLTGRIIIKVKAPGEKAYDTTVKKSITLKSIGTYKFKYTVTDPSNNQSVSVYRTIKSQDTKAPIIQSKDNFADLTLASDTKKISYKDLMKGITASLISGKKMTTNVSVKIKDPAGTLSTVMKNGTYKLSGAGEYTITYLCANANKSLKTGLYLSTRKTRLMTVLEPVSYELVVPEDLADAVTGTSIDLMEQVYVKATDPSKKKSEQVMKLTEGIFCNVTWQKNEGSKAKTVLVDDSEELLLEKNGIYKITYDYIAENGETLTAVRTITVSEEQEE